MRVTNACKLISQSTKTVYIHPAKCAGKSIEHVLFNFPKGGKSDHSRAWEYRYRHFPKLDTEKIPQFFYFSFVRNPWSRYVSSLFDRALRIDPENLKPEDINVDFVKSCLLKDLDCIKNSLHPPCAGGGMAPYREFFCSLDGNYLMNFVGKLENIESDWTTLRDKIQDFNNVDIKNWPKKLIKLNHKKHSERKHYSFYYDEESEKLLKNIYSWDIEFFDYKFEDKSK